MTDVFRSGLVSNRVLRVAGACAVLSVGIGRLVAQTIAVKTTTVSFSATSVKKNGSGASATELGFLGGGRFRAVNETVMRLIGEAYGEGQALPAFKIVGGPQWITSERYDVNAVAEGGPTPQEQHAMLRRLLADRFGLRAHVEQRDLTIYELVLDRREGKLGPQLRRSETQCAQPGTPTAGQAATPPAQPGTSTAGKPNQPPPCRMLFGRGMLGATGMTLAQLAGMGLSRAVGRDVIDRTGLPGGFDWTLTWTPEQRSSPPPDSPAAATLDDGMSIFTAVREQLGLKLGATRAPMDVLVVDQIERPAPD
jgi:uncharacterized protein (TIGR03435 family)